MYEKGKGKYRATVIKVLKKIFEKEYPGGLSEVSMECLLKWDHWPICIKIYSEQFLAVKKFRGMI